jgi:hypothetical protein
LITPRSHRRQAYSGTGRRRSSSLELLAILPIPTVIVYNYGVFVGYRLVVED